jgi:hypothetical protein
MLLAMRKPPLDQLSYVARFEPTEDTPSRLAISLVVNGATRTEAAEVARRRLYESHGIDPDGYTLRLRFSA